MKEPYQASPAAKTPNKKNAALRKTLPTDREVANCKKTQMSQNISAESSTQVNKLIRISNQHTLHTFNFSHSARTNPGTPLALWSPPGNEG